jgi:uncharacterized protein YdeI (YjbR/CyaY-like superfamily)
MAKATKKQATKQGTSGARPRAERSGTRPAATEPPVLAFADASALDAWLAENHASSRGIWLELAKKGSGKPSVTYAEAVEVALAWGWIDGLKHAHDDVAWHQKLTPRGAKSVWSKINRDKATALVAEGRMKPPGLAEVERAKADGRWDAAYDGARTSKMPDDLAAAFEASPRAKDFFATLDARNRYAVLWRVQTAKTAATRAARVAKLVAMLARGEKLHA